MGWVRVYTDANGNKTYNARYRDRWGVTQTAGTFRVRRDAVAAWRAAETRHAEGRIGDPRRGRQRFKTYVTETWLPSARRPA